MALLSPHRAERHLQVWAIFTVTWWVVSMSAAEILDSWRTSVGVRTVDAVVFAALALLLPALVYLYRSAIAEVRGLKEQYNKASGAALLCVGSGGLVSAGVTGAVLGVALAIVAGVMTMTIRTIPRDQMRRVADYANPEAWEADTRFGRFLQSGPGLAVGSVTIAVVIIVGVFVVVTLFG